MHNPLEFTWFINSNNKNLIVYKATVQMDVEMIFWQHRIEHLFLYKVINDVIIFS